MRKFVFLGILALAACTSPSIESSTPAPKVTHVPDHEACLRD